jgi:solute carrier family 25 (mitochondrial carnitine/acylcarnitine transporter), member 20/29
MAHNEKRTVWWKEAIFGLVTGIQYGITIVVIGQPFDTVKTKMQAQDDFKSKNFSQTMHTIFKKDGIKGFYSGGSSIVIGSSLFRSTQLLVFEAVHSRFDKNNLKNKNFEKFFTYTIPHTLGLEVRTVAAGLAAGIGRALVECPFEFIKVRKQTDNIISVKNIYRGIKPLILKNSLMICLGMSMLDSIRRNTNAWKTSYGLFIASGVCTLTAHILIWPIEVFKNYYMAHDKRDVKNINNLIRSNIRIHGVLGGIFRGALPGLISTVMRNGIALIIFQKMQRLITLSGLRN